MKRGASVQVCPFHTGVSAARVPGEEHQSGVLPFALSASRLLDRLHPEVRTGQALPS